jgi:hypothetical protein
MKHTPGLGTALSSVQIVQIALAHGQFYRDAVVIVESRPDLQLALPIANPLNSRDSLLQQGSVV